MKLYIKLKAWHLLKQQMRIKRRKEERAKLEESIAENREGQIVCREYGIGIRK